MQELNEIEIVSVSGGVDWEQIGIGVAIIGVGVAVVATAGLATVPLSLVGAATFGEILVGGSALAFAGAGGFAAGTGINSTKGTPTVTITDL